MSTDSARAYEQHALELLRYRDSSGVGVAVARRWAQSLQPGAEVIEIACGGGLPVSEILVAAGLKLWAIDSSPTLVSAFSNRFPGVPAKCERVQTSDFFRRSYDAAISIGLIFLLDESEQLELPARVAEILRPGAKFLFTAPLEAGTWVDAGTGHGCLSLGYETYRRVLEQSGFRLLACYRDSGQNNYYEAEKAVD